MPALEVASSKARPSNPKKSAFFRQSLRILNPFVGLVLAGVVLFVSPASAKPKVHVVYSGQRLGSIAKRYNVTVEELCKANGISKTAPIHPGQKLIIPGTDDGTGPQADTGSKKSGQGKGQDKAKAEATKPSGKARIHVVQKGHTLSAIAGRYAVTVSALCYANDLERNDSLSVGQKIIVPHKTDKGGVYARKQRDRGDFDDKSEDSGDKGSSSPEEEKANTKGQKSWEPYLKPAWRRGYIKIRRYGRSWEGYVIGPKNEVLGHASNKINFVLGAHDDGPRIDGKLIRLIASISDAFGGRELRIVSGYRTKSFVAASQHKVGKALDFSIPGVPNEALRDYLRTLDKVGVGYYPNSSFVHVDVRGYNSYWIDYAGPGEAPRKAPKSKASKKKAKAAPKEGEPEDQDEQADEQEDAPEHDHDHEEDGHGEDQEEGPDPSSDAEQAED